MQKNWVDENGYHQGGVAYGEGFCISWQRGALNENGRNGAFLLEVLEACRGQLQHYQEGRFACQENAEALTHLEQAIATLQSRLERRKAEGTLGTTQPDHD